MTSKTDLLKRAVISQARAVEPSVQSFTMGARILSMIAQVGVSFHVDGKLHREGLDREASILLKEHRSSSYQPGLGTWFTVHISVDRSGPVDVQFDYDLEPAWTRPVRDNYYADDFLRFPRDAEHTPPWLVEKLKKFEKELLEKGAQLPW